MTNIDEIKELKRQNSWYKKMYKLLDNTTIDSALADQRQMCKMFYDEDGDCESFCTALTKNRMGDLECGLNFKPKDWKLNV